jgi:hypothetical protein
VRGVNVRAKALGKRDGVSHPKIGRRYKQPSLLAYYLIVTVKHKLIPENFGTVINRHQMPLNLRIKAHSILDIFKKANEMNVLGSRKLHSRHGNYPLLFASCKKCRTVFTGIMVGKRQYL